MSERRGMFVMIVCEACSRQVQVLIADRWDIGVVEHDCEAERAFEVQRVVPDSAQAVMAI